MDHRAGSTALDQPPGPVPGNYDQLQPCPGRGTWAGHAGGAEGNARTRRARYAELKLPGHSPGIPTIALYRSAADIGRPGRGVPDPRHSLRKLYSSAHHSVDVAVG